MSFRKVQFYFGDRGKKTTTASIRRRAVFFRVFFEGGGDQSQLCAALRVFVWCFVFFVSCPHFQCKVLYGHCMARAVHSICDRDFFLRTKSIGVAYVLFSYQQN